MKSRLNSNNSETTWLREKLFSSGLQRHTVEPVLGGQSHRKLNTPLYFITDHLVQEISLKNATHFDLRRETWIQKYLEDYYQLYSSGVAVSDRLIQMENNENNNINIKYIYVIL